VKFRRTFLLGGERGELEGGKVGIVLRTRTKEGRQLFQGKKCTPEKNPGKKSYG